jgi:hypothetical protein
MRAMLSGLRAPCKQRRSHIALDIGTRQMSAREAIEHRAVEATPTRAERSYMCWLSS